MENVKLISKEKAVEMAVANMAENLSRAINDINSKIVSNPGNKIMHCFAFMSSGEKEALKILLERGGYEYKIVGECFEIDYSEDCINKIKALINEEDKKEWGEL